MATKSNGPSDGLQVKPAFRDLLPKLDNAEYARLKANIEEEGLLEPLTTWKDEEGYEWVVDGHHRLKACMALDIKPTTRCVDFACEADVMTWMVNHQAGRRNVKRELLVLARGRIYRQHVEAANGGSSAKKVAGEFGVSQKAVKNAKVVADWFDEKATSTEQAEYLAGNITQDAIMQKMGLTARKSQAKDGGEPDARALTFHDKLARHIKRLEQFCDFVEAINDKEPSKLEQKKTGTNIVATMWRLGEVRELIAARQEAAGRDEYQEWTPPEEAE